MTRLLNRIATRMWLFAGLMSVTTLLVAIGCYYAATYYQLTRWKEQMPPQARAEIEHLIATGQRGNQRYYELYDLYSSNDLRPGDVAFVSVIAVLSTLAGGTIAFGFARRISQPITAVAKAAARVAAGDRSARVDSSDTSGETRELVDSFNQMAADIEIFESERTVLTAGIAHELRTPLTILKGRLHALIDGVVDPASGEAQRLLRHVEHLSHLVEDLRTLAHADAGELTLDQRSIDLSQVVRTIVGDLRLNATAAGVHFKETYESITVRADPVRLTQVFTNLLTNAIKHAPPGTPVSVHVRSGAGEAEVTVLDEGPGFPEEDGARLFMPFWRGKSAGRPGSGLGLTLAAKLVEAHGGRITARNRKAGSGAIFSVWLPLYSQAASSEAQRSPRRAR